MIKNALLSLFFIVITFCSCVRNKDKSIKPEEIENIDQKIELSEESDTLTEASHYSQSQINELVKESIQKNAPIDTIMEFTSFICGEIFDVENFSIAVGEMDFKTLEVYGVSKGLQELLQVTSCYKKIDETDNYSAYIFIGEDESHYSNQFILITIDKASKEIHELELSYLYGSEIASITINTLFTSNKSLKRTSIQYINYLHGKIVVDSTIVTDEFFKIDELGKIIQL